MGLAIVGVIALLGAGGLLYAGLRAKKRLGQLTGTATSSCQEINGMFAGVAADLGAGALRRAVEVKGRAKHIGTDTLKTPLGATDCVWYRSTVTELYREYVWVGTGSDRRHQLEDKTRQLSDETSSAAFAVDDSTGTVVVDAGSAHVDHPIQSMNRTVTDDAGGWAGRLRLNLDFGGLTFGGGEGTTGYRHEEWTVPVDQQLYVSGEAHQDGSTVRIGKPEHGDLLVSTRTEEELVKSSTRGAVGFQIGAGALALVGLVLVVVGVA